MRRDSEDKVVDPSINMFNGSGNKGSSIFRRKK
jgi:hypothetical protein